MKKHGIEMHALAVALVPILILGILLESYFIYTRTNELNRAMFDRAKLIVRQLASSSEFTVFSGNLGLLQQQVDVAFSQEDVDSVVVFDASGKFLAGAGSSRELGNLVNGMPGDMQRVSMHEDDRMLRLFQPIVATQIELDDSRLSSPPSMNRALGLVILTISKNRLSAEKQQMLILSLMLSMLIAGIAMVISMYVSRRITMPILGMGTAVMRIGEGRLDTRIVDTNVRELDELAHGINEMAAQLQQQRNTMQLRIKAATQELREKKDEAEKANFDKTRFLAAASHDLRQPMHALGLFIGELQNRIDTPEQRKIVEKVEESVEAMSGLLDSLLDISKLDAGVVVPQEQEFALDVLLRRVAEDFSSLAEKKSITFRLRTVDAKVSSDPILLERILLNLISNAIRYVHVHGTVMVACRKRGDRIRIEVRDNGPGIPLAEQQNVFREFVQLSNTARDRSKGLGLGLAIVDRLAKLMQYPLFLRSAPQQGCNFAIEVPRVPDVHDLLAEDKFAQSPRVGAHDYFAELHVLVVDDDELVRNGTAGLISSWGCKVDVAECLAAVRPLCDKNRFDLVICDYRLPDGSGLDLAEDINLYPTHQTGFILISGDTSPEVLKKVADKGHHLLHKPVRPAKLRSMMYFVLNNRTR